MGIRVKVSGCVSSVVVVTLVDVILFAGTGIAITVLRSAMSKQHGNRWLAIGLAALVWGMGFVGYQYMFGTMLGDW